MASKKGMTINVDPDQVMYTNISKSKDGYNSSRVVVKVSDKEYMSINYEWEGDSVPDFVMGLMGFMQANVIEFGMVDKYTNDEYACKTCQEHNPELYDKKGNLIKKTAKKKEKCSDDDALEDE